MNESLKKQQCLNAVPNYLLFKPQKLYIQLLFFHSFFLYEYVRLIANLNAAGYDNEEKVLSENAMNLSENCFQCL